MPRGRKRLLQWLAALLCVAVLAACGPASAVPGPSDGASALPAAAEPVKAIVHDGFTIALPTQANADDKEAYQAFLQRLQGLLRGKGWNVALVDVPLPDSQSPEAQEGELIGTIRTQAATGRGPDAWRVSADIAKRLRAEGLTRDMAAVMPAASTMLWDLCKGSFAGGADGIPVTLATKTKYKPLGLMMNAAELGAYGAPIASADDILTFLEKRPDASIWVADNNMLTEAWAAQQGYYSLADYGLPPHFYARMEDANCTPVPAEDIDGFDTFFRRWTAMWIKGRLDNTGGDARKCSGMLSALSGPSVRALKQYLGLQGTEVVALPLAGCTQLPPADPLVCLSLLAVPVASRQAFAVATFAQWMLLDRQGYDLCHYGQQDVDYRLEGERVEYLIAGTPLTDADWNRDSQNPVPAFYWYGSGLGGYSDMVRVQKGSAANQEQALAVCKVETPPLWRVKALRKPISNLYGIFDITTAPYEDAINQHMEDVSYSVGTVNGVPERTADQVLQRLRDSRSKLDPLILDLEKRLKRMLDDPDGEPMETATTTP